MKIAYLVHSLRDYDELVENINQLIKQKDHVFIMINDNDLRDDVSFVYADNPYVHISHDQEWGQAGDMALARGTILQLRDAVEMYEFDYFINLTDSMIPIKTREEIVAFLEENDGKDFYYVDRTEKEDPNLRIQQLKYYTLTNLVAFPTSNFIRKSCTGIASILSALHIRRKLDDEYVIGSPWFMLCADTAEILAENFAYVSTTYKLGWYPEELYIPMMMNKFVYTDGIDKHVNQDYRVAGPNGTWIENVYGQTLTQELINAHPEALFGGSINTEDNLALYQDYFDKYNENYDQQQEQFDKEIMDPETLMHMLNRGRE